MFYTSIEEYIATMSEEEYLNIMMDAFSDEMAEIAEEELGM